MVERRQARPAPHPVFELIEPWEGRPAPDTQMNWVGIQTSIAYADGMDPTPETDVAMEYPGIEEETFEWIDLIESIRDADGAFTMVELGAGYGRWLANAAAVCRARGLDYRLVGVEGEPTHFAWMGEHLTRNSVDMRRVTLIEAAVAGRDGKTTFRVGGAFDCYGQRIPRSWRERLEWRRSGRGRSVRVRALTLASVLAEAAVTGLVDLIDLDVQSAEADVLEPAASLLQERVRRVHVGTHDPRSNEDRVRALFTRLGWEKLWDFPYGGASDTPLGRIEFQDGVQSWRNPRL